MLYVVYKVGNKNNEYLFGTFPKLRFHSKDEFLQETIHQIRIFTDKKEAEGCIDFLTRNGVAHQMFAEELVPA